MIPVRMFTGTCEITTGAFVPTNTPPAYQGEAQAIQVEVTMLQNGAAYTIPADVTPYIYLYYDEYTGNTTARTMAKQGSKVTTLLTEAEQALPGTPFLAIRLVGANGDVIVACKARIQIQRLLGKKVYITLSPEAYAQAIQAANEAAALANAAADGANAITASIRSYLDQYLRYALEIYDAYVQRFHDFETAYQGDYEAWVASLKDILSEEVAGNLLLLIEVLQERAPAVEIGTVDTQAASGALYPHCALLQTDWAFGMGGAGLGPAGGGVVRTVEADFAYDGYDLTVTAPSEFAAFTSISQLDNSTFAFWAGTNETRSLLLQALK